MAARPLISRDIFDFSSETTEGKSIKLDRKQDLNVSDRVCVFSGRSEKQDGYPASDWLRDCDFFSDTTERNSTKFCRNVK